MPYDWLSSYSKNRSHIVKCVFSGKTCYSNAITLSTGVPQDDRSLTTGVQNDAQLGTSITNMASKTLEWYSLNGLFGFRSRLNTSKAVIDLVDEITDCFHEGTYAIASFLDLTKAFDCVCHSLLLRKLYFYNLHPESVRLVSSYLRNRIQKVTMGETSSSYLPVTCSFPQGSILGPLLFLIFINDLPSNLTNSKVILYADDTTILNRGDFLEECEDKTLERSPRPTSQHSKLKATVFFHMVYQFYLLTAIATGNRIEAIELRRVPPAEAALRNEPNKPSRSWIAPEGRAGEIT
ncbi:uncharacterized protein LOC135129856 [Zophobas morio]|uniref:uncharacterized protein LOC135129856 n=1 Tax=Zophobas morio TaxID=2755281 RepID=UPI003083A7AD